MTNTPVTAATITLKDAQGHTQSASTQSDGSFTLTGTDIAYPALVRVEVPAPAEGGGIATLYAVLDHPPEGRISVSPLSTAQTAA